MDDPAMGMVCGFLDGTIISVEGGYRVLQHPKPARVFDRIADARWFLAVSFCDECPAAAGILNHEGKLSFQNEAALTMGETAFLPLELRKAVFDTCLTLSPGESTTSTIHPSQPLVQVWGLEIDPRYGRIAIIRTLTPAIQN